MGSMDAFVRKYDPSGTEIWTRQFGTTEWTEAYGIAINGSGVYVAGEAAGALPSQTNAGQSDAFVRAYDAAGNELWTRQFGAAGYDWAETLAVDASGVYVIGVVEEGALPGESSRGSADSFVCHYDSNGNDVWTKQFGSSDYDQPEGIAVNGTSVYVTGMTRGALTDQPNSGDWDAFVAKITIQTPGELVQQLVAMVVDLNLRRGLANSLDGKLHAAENVLNDTNQHNNQAAISSLGVFIKAVEEQRGIEISDADADALIAVAQRIINMLGAGTT
jgi:hypothetical protein